MKSDHPEPSSNLIAQGLLMGAVAFGPTAAAEAHGAFAANYHRLSDHTKNRIMDAAVRFGTVPTVGVTGSVGLAWFSPECTHHNRFSVARGGKKRGGGHK